jgi:UDP-glucose 4-epimerase
MKKILVTGGAGFIGSHLVNKLIEKNFEVNVLDNLSTGSIKNVNKKSNFIKGDIRDKKILKKAIKNCKIVYHLAAKTHLQESIINPSECIEINVTGTTNIIEICLIKKIKIIFASSCSLYPLSYPKKISENVITNPITPYSMSKFLCEKLLNFYSNRGKLETCILRCFNVYGKNQNSKSFYSAVIPKFIKNACKNKNLILNNGGIQKRDFVHVDDVVDAYIDCGLKKIIGTYNIGSGNSISIKRLANIIVKIAKSGKIKRGPTLDFDAKYSCANISLAKNKFNYSTKVKLEEGIKNILI